MLDWLLENMGWSQLRQRLELSVFIGLDCLHRQEDILAISIEPLAAKKLNEPHVVEHLVGSAERVTLSAGIAQKETRRLTDPGR